MLVLRGTGWSGVDGASQWEGVAPGIVFVPAREPVLDAGEILLHLGTGERAWLAFGSRWSNAATFGRPWPMGEAGAVSGAEEGGQCVFFRDCWGGDRG